MSYAAGVSNEVVALPDSRPTVEQTTYREAVYLACLVINEHLSQDGGSDSMVYGQVLSSAITKHKNKDKAHKSMFQ